MGREARAGNKRCSENGSNAEGCRSRLRAKRQWGYSSRHFPPYPTQSGKEIVLYLADFRIVHHRFATVALVKRMEQIHAAQNAEQRNSRAQIGSQNQCYMMVCRTA